MALVLAQADRSYEDTATKFFEHFAYIAEAMRDMGLWDDKDGFFYDVLRFADGTVTPLRVRSVVGLLPLCATTTLGEGTLRQLPDFAERFAWFLANKPRYRAVVGARHVRDGHVGRLLSIVDGERLGRILATMLSEEEFLSPYGIRALSRRHAAEPFSIELAGSTYTVDYEPGEGTTGLFGGNSNWRGPVWFPVNFLLVEALQRFARFYGEDVLLEHPTGSGRKVALAEVADDLRRRLISLFLEGPDGRRPVFGDSEPFGSDPRWHGLVCFFEYFHGDTGRGLGASHQTGWTGLVAELILSRGRYQ
jgi:hypothetical protein